MARAKQLRPLDHMTQSLLAEAVRESNVTHADIGEMAGMSQNRVSIILRLETPPATVGEVSAIAHSIGRSGSEFIAAAEAEIASGRHLEGGFSLGSSAFPQQHRNDDVVPDRSAVTERRVAPTGVLADVMPFRADAPPPPSLTEAAARTVAERPEWEAAKARRDDET